MTHEMCNRIKGLAIVIKKNAGINACMYYQKCYQEKAGKAHSEFFPNRRSEKLFPGHKANIVCDLVLQK